MSDTPRFEHDCDACLFLGKLDMIGHKPADIWFCAKTIGGGSVIARFGDDGADYSSFLLGLSEENWLRPEGKSPLWYRIASLMAGDLAIKAAIEKDLEESTARGDAQGPAPKRVRRKPPPCGDTVNGFRTPCTRGRGHAGFCNNKLIDKK